MRDAVIVSAVRTPVGKFQGLLSSFAAPRLGALVVREAVRRAGIEAEQVEECIMGCVIQAGLGQNPARQAALYGGMRPESAALTINQVCGSGLRAAALAAQAIQTGDAEIMVAGGMESMTNAPYLLLQARGGYRMGNGTLVDSMVYDGLWEVYKNYHMGVGGELIAAKYGISREEQDAFAAESHRRAAEATAKGCFRDEILPVEIPEAGVSGGRDRHGGQLSRGERWSRGGGCDERGPGAGTGTQGVGRDSRAGNGRARAGVVWSGSH